MQPQQAHACLASEGLGDSSQSLLAARPLPRTPSASINTQPDTHAHPQDHTLATKGCLCVWDLGNPSRPKHVLISEGAPSCCAVGPSPGQNLMFAGGCAATHVLGVGGSRRATSAKDRHAKHMGAISGLHQRVRATLLTLFLARPCAAAP